MIADVSTDIGIQGTDAETVRGLCWYNHSLLINVETHFFGSSSNIFFLGTTNS